MVADASTSKAISINKEYDGFMLDLAGHSLTCSGDFSIGMHSSLTVTGSGSIYAVITIKTGGDCILDDWTGTITSVVMESDCVFSTATHNGAVGTVENIQYNGGVGHLSCGTFEHIYNNTKDDISLSSLLSLESAFRDESGTLLKGAATIAAGGSIDNLTVVDCTTHVDEDNDDHCDYCDQFIDARVTTESGETTYYKSLTDAFAAANKNNGCTLTLLDNVSLGSNLMFVTGNFTLDLNGHTIDALYVGQNYDIENNKELNEPIPGSLTIADSDRDTKGSITEELQLIDGTLNIQGGIIGKVLDDGATAGSLSCDSGNVTISGGTFGTIANTDAGSKIPVMPLLAKGYAFYNGDTVQDGSTDKALENVTVKSHSHTIENGKCACGATCVHETVGEDGKCTICGTQFVAECNGKYYDSLYTALIVSGNTGKTAKILKDTSLVQSWQTANGTKYALDLNGKTITVTRDFEVWQATLNTMKMAYAPSAASRRWSRRLANSSSKALAKR